MKKYSKYLTIAAVVMFLMGLLVTGYFLFNLPDNLYNSLKITELSQITETNSILNTIKIVVGLELFIGLCAIILLITRDAGVTQQTSASVMQNRQEHAANAADGGAGEEDLTENEARAKRITANIDPKAGGRQNFDHVLSALCHELEASQSAVFLNASSEGKKVVRMFASFAYHIPESQVLEYEYGEGLTGQVAKEGKTVHIQAVPEGYIKVLSGLGSATPGHLVIAPLKLKNKMLGVMEVASFKNFSKADIDFIDKVAAALAEMAGKDKTLAPVEN